MKHTYLNCLAQLGIGAAHPGGIQLTKKILSREKIEKTASLLDAGCGTGQTSAYISDLYGCKVTSLDSNKTMVDKAKQRFQSQKLPIEVKLGSTENQPFDDASFDIVLSESVIVFTNI